MIAVSGELVGTYGAFFERFLAVALEHQGWTLNMPAGMPLVAIMVLGCLSGSLDEAFEYIIGWLCSCGRS
jgi:hypothetical protein